MKTRLILLAIAMPCLALACEGPEFHQLDFWVGIWDVRWDGGHGVNKISRTMDGCVIEEDFREDAAAGDLHGRSLSMYNARTGLWRQSWVDDQGGFFSLTGGPRGPDFVLEDIRIDDKSPYLRMVYTDIKPDSLTWHWQKSEDHGAHWQDNWVIHYRRKGM